MKQIAPTRQIERSELIQFIRGCELYSTLSPSEIEALHPHAKTVLYEKGKFIYLPGHPSDQIFHVYSGSVRMATLMESGKEFTSSLYHAGETFGELSLAGETHRVEMAISCEKTFLIAFKCEALTDLLRQNLLFTLRLMQLIGSRRHESENKLLQFFYTPVHSRLARLLIHFATKHTKVTALPPVQLRLTHEVLASLAGTTRETTTMILNRFEKMGMIHKSKGSIFIKDLQSLKAFYQNRTPLEQNKTLTLPQVI